MATKSLRVTQKRSTIGLNKRQAQTLRGLGLGKLHRTAELPDNDATWGMIRKLGQLVQVEK